MSFTRTRSPVRSRQGTTWLLMPYTYNSFWFFVIVAQYHLPSVKQKLQPVCLWKYRCSAVIVVRLPSSFLNRRRTSARVVSSNDTACIWTMWNVFSWIARQSLSSVCLYNATYTKTPAKDLLRAGFEPATYGFLPDTQLQSTALPTELSKVIYKTCVRERVCLKVGIM